MKLKYAQKQYIKNHYFLSTPEQIATNLQVGLEDVEKHIHSNKKLFDKKKKRENIRNIFFEKKDYFILALLAIFVLIIYFNGINADFVSDDLSIPAQEKLLSSTSYFLNRPFFFFQSIRYYVIYNIGGLNPALFRMVNIIFHIGFVMATYMIVKTFTKNNNLPFFVAALAAVHPMMVESVTWISGGVYSQSSFIVLIALYCYIVGKKTNAFRWVISSYIFFLIALSTSEKMIIFPFIIALYEYCFGSIWTHWKKLVPFFSISALYGLVLTTMVGERVDALNVAVGNSSSIQIENPLLQVPAAIGTYIKLFFWPDKLTLYQSEFQLNVVTFIFLALLFFGYGAFMVWSHRNNKKLFFWQVFFIISLLPTLNPFGLSWIVAERYSYLSSIGLYYVFVVVFFKLFDKKIRSFGYVVLTIILVLLSVRTIARNIDWQNEDNLWIATGKTSPSDPKTHNNLGDVYGRRGDLQKAAGEFTRAIELNPNYADAYHNLGNTYQQMGSPSAALQLYQKAYEINPNLWQSLQQIAFIHFQNKDFETAVNYMKQAIEISPSNSSLYVNIGIMYKQLGDVDSARASFNQALEIDPENETATQALNELPL